MELLLSVWWRSREGKIERYIWSKGFSYENIFINFWDVYVKFCFGISFHVFVQYTGTIRCFKRKLLKIKV